jgi:hypothetical protein
MLLACYSYFVYRGIQWNPDSRLALTFALVEQGSLSIDSYHQNTEDKAFHNNHYYSDKAIGASLIAVPFYFLLKLVLLDTLPANSYFLVRYALTFFAVAIPSAIFGIIYYNFLREFSGINRSFYVISKPAKQFCANPEHFSIFRSELLCLAVALGYCLGTIAFPFSTLFFGHQLAGIMLFGSFLLVFRRKAGRMSRRDANAAYGRMSLTLAGFLAGYAVLTEYPAFIGLLLIGVYVSLDQTPRASRGYRDAIIDGAIFLLGAIPPILTVLIYNTLAFGHPFSQGYANLGGSPEFIEGMSRGIMGITLPSISALWEILFSPYRGVFFFSPFLLLTFPGLWLAYRAGWRSEAWLFALIFLCFITLNSSYEFWDGGHSLGPRHILPSIPFVAAPVLFAAVRWPRIALLMVLLSIAMIVVATATDSLPAPIYANPLLDRNLPKLLDGSLGNNWGMVFGLRGGSSLIPLGAIVSIVIALSICDLRSVAREYGNAA